jgi:hypothetical protein
MPNKQRLRVSVRADMFLTDCCATSQGAVLILNKWELELFLTDDMFQGGIILTLDRLLESVADDGRRRRIHSGRQESALQV